MKVSRQRHPYHLTAYFASVLAGAIIGQYSPSLQRKVDCPLTPAENRLKVPIRAGEMVFPGVEHA